MRADRLFQTLLREVVSGSPHGGVRQMQIPATVDCGRLVAVIRREFRRPTDDTSDSDAAVRRDVAFRALRELHKKIAYAASLAVRQCIRAGRCQSTTRARAAPATGVVYLRPGAYLLAHPLMTGYFCRTVICLLDHVPEEDDDDTTQIRKSYGTYGLVVNRVSYRMHHRRNTAATIVVTTVTTTTIYCR